MRIIRHPEVIELARDWLRRNDGYARWLERAPEREVSAPAAADKLLVDDRRYFVELLDGCVWWVRVAVPLVALPVDVRKRSPDEIALQRLGLTDAASATLGAVSRHHVLRVLHACDDNQSATARVLDVNLRTVQRFVAEKPRKRRR